MVRSFIFKHHRGENTANGYEALYSNTTGNNNTANGLNALYSNTTGSNNTANGMTSFILKHYRGENTASGAYALYQTLQGVIILLMVILLYLKHYRGRKYR